MIPHWANIGAKVVCIDQDMIHFGTPLSIGEIYTISKVIHSKGGRLGKYTSPTVGVILVEIKNPFAPKYGEFALARFRPLITLEDDMKLFEHLKNPSLVDKLDLLAERMNELAED